MPRSSQTITITGSSDESESDDVSCNSDQNTVISTVGSEKMDLSDQTLLVQAFRGSVKGRQSAARDWLVDRVEDIKHAEDQVPPATHDKSYSTKLRNLMRKLNISKK